MEALKKYCRSVGWKRFLVMVAGNVFIGMGVGIFKLSALGTDPFNGMNMALGDLTGIPYPVLQIIVNVVMLAVEIGLARHLIGFGTVVNAVFLGYFATFFYWIFSGFPGHPQAMPLKLITVCVGVVVISFGLSLYQQSDAGVAPFDSMALILSKRCPKIPYFWCRMAFDGTCALICYLAGGVIGLGTLVCAFGMGPIIHFFDKTVTARILRS